MRPLAVLVCLGLAAPASAQWEIARIDRAGAHAIGGDVVIVATEGFRRLLLLDARTGRARTQARAPGIRWEGAIATRDGMLATGEQAGARVGVLLDPRTGRPRWTIPLEPYEALRGGLDGTGAARAFFSYRCEGHVIDMATGAAIGPPVIGRQVRVNFDSGDHSYQCGEVITVIGAAAGHTIAIEHGSGAGIYAFDSGGSTSLLAADGEIHAVGLAGSAIWFRTERGIVVASVDIAAGRLRWSRSFPDAACAAGDWRQSRACSAREVTVPGREPFVLVETGVTAVALAADGGSLWSNRGRSSALVFVAGEVRGDALGRSRRVFGSWLDYRWIDADGHTIAELARPPGEPNTRIQIPVGDDAVLIQDDTTLRLLASDGTVRWSQQIIEDFFVDDVAGGVALVRIEDQSTRHLRLIRLTDGSTVREIRDVQPVLTILGPRIVLWRMGGGLMSFDVP